MTEPTAEGLKKFLSGRDPGDEDDQMDVPKDEVVFVGTPEEHTAFEEKSAMAQRHKGMFREFSTGATRNNDDDQLDYEGFLSPQVLHRFAQYMHEHRVQADGSKRTSDNWQNGIPEESYMKSMTRHFMDLWLIHRGIGGLARTPDIEETLCALLFNVQGMLFEVMNPR